MKNHNPKFSNSKATVNDENSGKEIKPMTFKKSEFQMYENEKVQDKPKLQVFRSQNFDEPEDGGCEKQTKLMTFKATKFQIYEDRKPSEKPPDKPKLEESRLQNFDFPTKDSGKEIQDNSKVKARLKASRSQNFELPILPKYKQRVRQTIQSFEICGLLKKKI